LIVAFAPSGESRSPNPLATTDHRDKACKNPGNDPRGLWEAGDLSARKPHRAPPHRIRLALPPDDRAPMTDLQEMGFQVHPG
jgi:hypothetical protein